jgi:hypothetical protein
LERGVNSNYISDSQPLLYIASLNGRLDYGADPRILNREGDSAQTYALEEGYDDIASYIYNYKQSDISFSKEPSQLDALRTNSFCLIIDIFNMMHNTSLE